MLAVALIVMFQSSLLAAPLRRARNVDARERLEAIINGDEQLFCRDPNERELSAELKVVRVWAISSPDDLLCVMAFRTA